MIVKDMRASSFRAAVQYTLRHDHDPQTVGGNVAGRWPGEIVREFERARGLRPDVEKPVHHVALSLAPEDRRLSAPELGEVARRYVEAMGYRHCYYLAVEHRDRPHQHVHLVISRIRTDGSLVPWQYRDWARGHEVARAIERDFGLRVLETPRDRSRRDLTPAEYRLAVREQKASERAQLQALVGKSWHGRPSLTEFVRRLEDLGVQVRFAVSGGQIVGVSYGLEAFSFRGGALGKSYTWRGLLTEGVSYDAARDRAVVGRLGRDLQAPPRAEGRTARVEADTERLRLIVRETLSSRPTLTEFVERLADLGVRIRLNVATTGHVSGVSYSFEGRTFKGSELGREFSWKGIQRQGLSFDPERDREAAARLGRALPVPGGRERGGASEELRGWIHAAVVAAIAGRPTLAQFVGRLKGAGVAVRLFQDASGGVIDIAYRVGGVEVLAKDLGHSWRELEAQHLLKTGDVDVLGRVGTLLRAQGMKEPGRLREAVGKGRRDQVRALPLQQLARVYWGAREIQSFLTNPAAALARHAARLAVREIARVAREQLERGAEARRREETARPGVEDRARARERTDERMTGTRSELDAATRGDEARDGGREARIEGGTERERQGRGKEDEAAGAPRPEQSQRATPPRDGARPAARAGVSERGEELRSVRGSGERDRGERDSAGAVRPGPGRRDDARGGTEAARATGAGRGPHQEASRGQAPQPAASAGADRAGVGRGGAERSDGGLGGDDRRAGVQRDASAARSGVGGSGRGVDAPGRGDAGAGGRSASHGDRGVPGREREGARRLEPGREVGAGAGGRDRPLAPAQRDGAAGARGGRQVSEGDRTGARGQGQAADLGARGARDPERDGRLLRVEQRPVHANPQSQPARDLQGHSGSRGQAPAVQQGQGPVGERSRAQQLPADHPLRRLVDRVDTMVRNLAQANPPVRNAAEKLRQVRASPEKQVLDKAATLAKAPGKIIDRSLR